MANLLPTHYSEHEKNLEAVGESVIDRIMENLWSGRLHDPMTIPAKFLFALGKYRGIEYWWQNISEEEHRSLIAEFPMIKRRRGTLWSVKQALNVIDPNGHVVEGDYQYKRDAMITRNGLAQHGTASHWAEFVVIASKPMINAQATQLRGLIESVAPERSRLIRIDYTAVANIRNGAIMRDGNYNRGAA